MHVFGTFGRIIFASFLVLLAFLSPQAATAQTVSVSFAQGFIGTVGANKQDAIGIQRFSTLGVVSATFSQASTTGLFTSTGSGDIAGTLRLVLGSGQVITRAGSIVWRLTAGSTINAFGFIPNAGTPSTTFSYGAGLSYTISPTSNFALRLNTSSLTFTDGTNVNGNAGGGLAALNAYLGTSGPSSPVGPVTVTGQSTASATPTITGTATRASGETLTVEVNGIAYTTATGLVVSGTTWSLTIPGGSALAPGTYSVTAIITNAAGYTLADGTSNELVIQPPNTLPVANAGPDQTVASAAAVTLDGSASADADAGDTITYAWTQSSGTAVTLSSATAQRPGFTAPTLAIGAPSQALVFSLVVRDQRSGVSVADAVTITVTAPSAVPGDVATSTVGVSASSVVADGISTVTVTIVLRAADGTPLTASGGAVALSTTLGILGPVTDNGDGTYTAILTSSTTAGTALISAALNGQAIADTASVVFAGPGDTTFDNNADEIRSVIVDNTIDTLRDGLTASQSVVEGARHRFAEDLQRAANENCGDDTPEVLRKSDGSLEECQANLRLTLGGNVPFTMSTMGQATADGALFQGDFYGLSQNALGTRRQLLFGEFDFTRDEDGQTSGYLQARLLNEFRLNRSTLVGLSFGVNARQQTVDSGFTGTQSSQGLSIGTYFVRSLGRSMFLDGFLDFGVGKNQIDLSRLGLQVEGDYTSRTLQLGGTLSGTIKYAAFDLEPQISFAYAHSNVGSIDVLAQTAGTITNEAVDIGSVSLARLSFTPEVHVPLALSEPGSAMFNFSPILLCEWTQTVMGNTTKCGGAVTFKLSSTSADGNGKVNAKLRVERIGDVTRSSIGFEFLKRF